MLRSGKVDDSGGGTTLRSEASLSGNIQIFVSNNAVASARAVFKRFHREGEDYNGDAKGPLTFGSVYEIDAHEHGHAYDLIINGDLPNSGQNGYSVTFENAVRSRVAGSQRRTKE